ncbi:hypothetical protein DOY81_002159, partial [Sarcophaga bullata]
GLSLAGFVPAFRILLKAFIAINAIVPSDYRIQSPASGSPLPLANTTNTDLTVAVLTNNTNAVNSVSGNANTAGGPNTVLRVIVESQLYPVSLDILHQIFQRFGKV